MLKLKCNIWFCCSAPTARCLSSCHLFPLPPIEKHLCILLLCISWHNVLSHTFISLFLECPHWVCSPGKCLNIFQVLALISLLLWSLNWLRVASVYMLPVMSKIHTHFGMHVSHHNALLSCLSLLLGCELRLIWNDIFVSPGRSIVCDIWLLFYINFFECVSKAIVSV